MIFAQNATSQSLDVQIVDDSGLAVTGLVAATFPATFYSLAGPNADVSFPALSDLASITSPWTAGGVKERANGYYRLDAPNAIFTTLGISRVFGEATGKHLLCPPLEIMAPWLNAASYTAPAVPAAISQARAIGNEPYTKTFTQNDLRTGIGDQLIDAQTGSPINLTGSTVTFRMISQVDKSIKINDVAATLSDASNGKVAYSWTGTDLDTPGLYWGWWKVTTSGKTEHFPGDGEKMTVKVVTAE